MLRLTFDYQVKGSSYGPPNMRFSSLLSLSLISKHSLSPLPPNTADLAALFWVVEERSDVSEGRTASIFRKTSSTFLREVGTFVHGAEKRATCRSTTAVKKKKLKYYTGCGRKT